MRARQRDDVSVTSLTQLNKLLQQLSASGVVASRGGIQRRALTSYSATPPALMLASPATPCRAVRGAPQRVAPRRAPLRRCAAARVVSASAAPPSPVVILPGLGNAAEDYVALSAALEAQLGAVVRTAQARQTTAKRCAEAAPERRPRPRRCRARTGCATRRAWLTRPTGAASCAPRRRWTGAAHARPWRARAGADPLPPPPPARYLERMTAAIADARAASGQRRVSLLVRCWRGSAAVRRRASKLTRAARRRTAQAAGSRACGCCKTVRARCCSPRKAKQSKAKQPRCRDDVQLRGRSPLERTALCCATHLARCSMHAGALY